GLRRVRLRLCMRGRMTAFRLKTASCSRLRALWGLQGCRIGTGFCSRFYVRLRIHGRFLVSRVQRLSIRLRHRGVVIVVPFQMCLLRYASWLLMGERIDTNNER